MDQPRAALAGGRDGAGVAGVSLLRASPSLKLRQSDALRADDHLRAARDLAKFRIFPHLQLKKGTALRDNDDLRAARNDIVRHAL